MLRWSQKILVILFSVILPGLPETMRKYCSNDKTTKNLLIFPNYFLRVYEKVKNSILLWITELYANSNRRWPYLYLPEWGMVPMWPLLHPPSIYSCPQAGSSRARPHRSVWYTHQPLEPAPGYLPGTSWPAMTKYLFSLNF